MFVPHRKHIASPLWAQQVNAIYRFVTMVQYYNYLSSGYYQSSSILFKNMMGNVRNSLETHYLSATSPS
jgi:hypothetical protein